MTEIAPEDRPREKLLRRGAAALTNSELLAIFIRTGVGTRNALDIAREVLAAGEGQLSGVHSLGVEGLKRIDGIGKDKAAGIMAAMEVGRRFFDEKSGVDVRHITSPEEIYMLMLPEMKKLDYEQAWALFLTSKHRLIKKECLCSGGSGMALVDSKDLIRRAISCKADTVVLVHNHPSGSPEPGKDDILTTENIRKALSVMDIHLLDHVIVSEGAFFSFADEGVKYL